MSPVQDDDLKQFIRHIPDFPQPGILFRDITPLLGNQAAFHRVIDLMADSLRGSGVEAIVGIESRGFLFGGPLAYQLALPFVPVRKAGKLPAPVMSVEYALEYGTNQLDIHKDALRSGQSVAVVDDLIATGGTAAATAKLVEGLGATVQAFLFLVELTALGGRDRLSGHEVRALISY